MGLAIEYYNEAIRISKKYNDLPELARAFYGFNDNTKNLDLVKLMKQLSQIRDHDAEYDEKLASLEAKKLNFLEDYVC